MVSKRSFYNHDFGQFNIVAGDIETTGFYDDDVITTFGLACDEGYVVWVNGDGVVDTKDTVEENVNNRVDLAIDVRVVLDEGTLLESVRQYIVEMYETRETIFVFYNGERWNGGFDLRFIRSACLRTGATFPFAGYAFVDLLPVFGKHDRFNVTHADPSPDLGDLFNKAPLKEFADYLNVEYSNSWKKSRIIDEIECNESFTDGVLEKYCENNDIDAPVINPRGLVPVFNRVVRLMQQRSNNTVSDEWFISDPDPFGPEESFKAVESFYNGDLDDLILHNVADIHKTRMLAKLLSMSGGMVAKNEVEPTFF